MNEACEYFESIFSTPGVHLKMSESESKYSGESDVDFGDENWSESSDSDGCDVNGGYDDMPMCDLSKNIYFCMSSRHTSLGNLAVYLPTLIYPKMTWGFWLNRGKRGGVLRVNLYFCSLV